MKRYSYYIVALFLILNCKENLKTETFSFLEYPAESIVNINLNVTDSLLIKDIERQLDYDLCENMTFTGEINYDKKRVLFPALAFKNCEDYAVFHNIIPVSISGGNEVFIQDSITSKEINIQNRIVEATKLKIQGTQRKSIIYRLVWHPKLNVTLTKQRLYEILKGIELYSNEVAVSNFNKPIKELTNKELDSLKSIYTAFIGFSDYIPPPPPLPPLDRE